MATRHPGWHRSRQPPRWNGTAPRGRVLLEHPDARVREVIQRSLEEHGYRVVACGGPESPDGAMVCPVLRQEPCPAVEGADAVIAGLDLDDPSNRLLVDRIVQSRPDRPMIVASDLRVTTSSGGEIGPHHLYRTTIAPLVRRLYDLLHAPRRSEVDA